MLSMLIAYDAAGNVVATNDYIVAVDETGRAMGLLDFEAHEKAGGKLRDFWQQSNAVGSGTWPEWIGGRAYDFTVELTGKKITALVHKKSGLRRERAAIEGEIANRIKGARGKPADLRDLVGGPSRPLVLDDAGETIGRTPAPTGTPKHLPVGKALGR